MSKFSDAENKSNWQRAKELFYSVSVGLIVAFASILAWTTYDNEVMQAEKNRLNLSGQFISSQFNNALSSNIQTLQNFKSRIETSDGAYFDYWRHDAELILEQNPSFTLIEWIDSTGVIKFIEPERGNESTFNLNIREISCRGDDWFKSGQDKSINITHWSQLTSVNHSFLVDAPVYFDGVFQGTVTAGMNFTDHFDDIMRGREVLNLRMYDQGGNLFYQSGEYTEADTISFSAAIPLVSGEEWLMVLSPGKAFFRQSLFYEYKIGIILSLVIAGILSITIFFMLKSSWESKRVIATNQQLRTLNIELDKQKQKAEKASQIKTEFLSNMSHEIRTPLNAIMGLVTILQNQTENAVQRARYLGMMEFSSKNLLSIVNDILEIDKVEAGGIELNIKPFDPVNEIENLLNLYEEGFEKKQVDLIREFPKESSIQVLSDSVKFGQIVTNLVRNAYKFTEEGEVRVSLSSEVVHSKLEMEVVVSDTGIGIPAESLDHIFDRFAQVESGMKKKYEGTGLGLAITKKIVEKLGGTIIVKSEVGRGSEFRVKLALPIYQAQRTESVIPALGEGISTGKILIAEDNPLNVMVITKLLENYALDVDVVPNGKEVMLALNNGGYDLIFMDIHMPEMDGLETTRLLREKGIETPVVALSANVTQEAVNEAREAGMNDYVTKPFTRETLEGVLVKFIQMVGLN